jgi:tryptophan synthase alpha subunit
MAKVSDGAIVGSAIIKFFAQYGPAAQLLTPPS